MALIYISFNFSPKINIWLYLLFHFENIFNGFMRNISNTKFLFVSFSLHIAAQLMRFPKTNVRTQDLCRLKMNAVCVVKRIFISIFMVHVPCSTLHASCLMPMLKLFAFMLCMLAEGRCLIENFLAFNGKHL